jgi:hypothetical protein
MAEFGSEESGTACSLAQILVVVPLTTCVVWRSTEESVGNVGNSEI